MKKKKLSNAIFYILLSNIVNINNSNIGSCRRTTLPLPHGFSVSRYSHALLPHTSTLEDNLIVFNEEENLCYMVPCLDYGDPLTARETFAFVCACVRSHTLEPCRYSDLIPRLGRPVPELSMISNLVIDTIYQEHNHSITQWNDTLLNPPLLENYAHAI